MIYKVITQMRAPDGLDLETVLDIAMMHWFKKRFPTIAATVEIPLPDAVLVPVPEFRVTKEPIEDV